MPRNVRTGVARPAAGPSTPPFSGAPLKFASVRSRRLAERRRGGRPGAAGVLPLRFGRQPAGPPLRQRARLLGPLGQRPAVGFRGDVRHPVDRHVVAEAEPLGQWTLGRRAVDPPPVGLRRLAGGHPEAAAQRDLDLRLVVTAPGLGRRTAHRESPRRAPAEADALELAPLAGHLAGEWRILGRVDPRGGEDRHAGQAEESERVPSSRHRAT